MYEDLTGASYNSSIRSACSISWLSALGTFRSLNVGMLQCFLVGCFVCCGVLFFLPVVLMIKLLNIIRLNFVWVFQKKILAKTINCQIKLWEMHVQNTCSTLYLLTATHEGFYYIQRLEEEVLSALNTKQQLK